MSAEEQGTITGNQLKTFFTAALIEVVSTMTGFTVAVSEDSADVGCFDEQISGVMQLSGTKNGMIIISVSGATARAIVSYMTGLLPAEINRPDLADGIAELVNMVAGRAKSFLQETGYRFNLTTPFAVVGGKHDIVIKNKLAVLAQTFRAESMKILLKIYFQ